MEGDDAVALAWEVHVVMTKRLIRQRFHLRIVDTGNRKILAASETYRDKDECLVTAHLIADPAGAPVVAA